VFDFVPWLSPHLSYFAIYYRPVETSSTGTEESWNDWKNLPGWTNTMLLLYIRCFNVESLAFMMQQRKHKQIFIKV
jgi:hypothetical protein